MIEGLQQVFLVRRERQRHLLGEERLRLKQDNDPIQQSLPTLTSTLLISKSTPSFARLNDFLQQPFNY